MDYPQQHIKPYNEEGKKTEQVERMFDNIAHAYDKLNHTLSLGIDRSWRRKAIAWLRPFHPQRMMDVWLPVRGISLSLPAANCNLPN